MGHYTTRKVMKLFTPTTSNSTILKSLGFGLVMIDGSRNEVRDKLKSVESSATPDIKDKFNFDYTINLKETELGVIFNSSTYITTANAKETALKEYTRITGAQVV